MAGQSTFPQSCTEPIFVGLAGHIGAGKTSAATYLIHKYGFQYRRYSQVLDEWISGSASNRDRLQQIGWDVMAGGLQAELNARVIAGIDRSISAAVDGLRHLVDFESLSATLGVSFQMIFLDARQEHRFERLQSRFSTLAAFHTVDSHPVEAHIDDLRALASITLTNDDSLEHLYQQLDAWVATRTSGDRL
jgi:dephospho-CoA kinase